MNNKKEETEEKCDECGLTEFATNYERAEKICKACGLVIEYQEFSANDDTRQFGENATTTGVRTFGVTDKNNALGSAAMSKKDIRKLPASQRRAFYTIRLIERGTVRDRHPFFGLVMKELDGFYGRNTADRLEFLARMSCLPLTKEQEKIRDGLKSCDQKRLAMPKQSICRLKAELKGGSESERSKIIAIALAELGGDLQITNKIDRRFDLMRYGLTDKQILSAKMIIMKHYKGRIGLLGEPAPRRIHPSELRCDDADQVIAHLEEALSSSLSDADLDLVHRNAAHRLDLLGEPGDMKNSPLTVNTNIRMVIACTYYATLQSLGLADGLLNRVATTCRLTGSGVSSRLEQFRDEDATGKLFVDGAFEDFIGL